MAEVTVTTFAELEVAVHDNEDTPIHLNAASFVLTEDLIIDHNCVIDIVYDGDVTIDGNDLYKVTVKNNTAIIGNSAGDHRLIFTQGDDFTVLVDDPASDTNLIFYYCDFAEAKTSKGFEIYATSAVTIDVICISCRAMNNYNDGFSISTFGTTIKTTLICYNCQSYDNGPGSAQGFTTHNAKEVLFIYGGLAANNNINAIGCYGGEIYAFDVTLEGGIYIDTTGGGKTSKIILDGIDQTYNGTGKGITVKTTDGNYDSYFVLYNSYVKGNSLADHGIEVTKDCVVVIENTIVTGFTRTSKYGVYLGADRTIPALLRNCVISGNNRGVYLLGNVTLTNCIVANHVGRAINGNITTVYAAGGSSHNIFYNNVGHHYDADTSSILTDAELAALKPYAGDQNIDPQFVDAASGDFRLKPGSPCLNTGRPTPQNGFSSIGAWQKKQGAPAKSIIYRG